MDVEVLVLLVAACVGTAAAALHLIGWLPPRYRRVLVALQVDFAQRVGLEVRNALEALYVRLDANAEEGSGPAFVQGVAARFEALPAAIGVELEAALNRVAETQKAQMLADTASLVKGAEMSIVRGVGVDKLQTAKVGRLIGEAVLGPALPILRQFAPGLADALEENPQLLDVVISNPLFQKYVAPRLQAFLGGQQNAGETVTSSGWGT